MKSFSDGLLRSCFALALMIPAASLDARIILNATLNQTEVVNTGTNTYKSRIYASSGDGLIQDFSTIDETEIIYNLHAPPGKYFEITTGASWTGLEFNLRYQNGGIGQGTGQFRTDSPIITFNPIAGGALFNPASYTLNFVSISGPGGNLNRGWVRGNASVSTTYRFNKVTFQATVPAGYNVNINTAFGNAYIELEATSTDFSGGAPASFANIVPDPDPYGTWSGGQPFGNDINGDGIANGLAWALGASGPNVDATSLLPTADLESGNLVIRFSIIDDEDDNVDVLVQWSSDLGISDQWGDNEELVPAASGTPAIITYTITPNGYMNEIEASIPGSEAAGGKLFARIQAQLTP